MRRLAISSVFGLLLLIAARSQPQQAVTELVPGVFFWQGDTYLRKPANCTWVIFRDYVLAIDANFPWAAREILAAIRRTTDKPIRFVFDTHYHADHSFGNRTFMDAGATVVCSQECDAESRAKGEADWRNQIFTALERPNPSEHARTVAKETRDRGYRLEHPTLLFEDRLVFDDGAQRVELIRVGPAHTRGDAVAWVPKAKILVTGDLCVNWKNGNNLGDPDADPENWTRVLDGLIQWDAKTVVPGHGLLGTTATLAGQRAWLADMIGQIRKGIEAAKPEDQMVREVTLSRHQPWGAAPSANSIRAVYRRLTRPDKP